MKDWECDDQLLRIPLKSNKKNVFRTKFMQMTDRNS